MSIAYPVSNSNLYLVESPNSNILTDVSSNIINNFRLNNEFYQSENFSNYIDKNNKKKMKNDFITEFSESQAALPGIFTFIIFNFDKKV